jgi:hypothetical protein
MVMAESKHGKTLRWLGFSRIAVDPEELVRSTAALKALGSDPLNVREEDESSACVFFSNESGTIVRDETGALWHTNVQLDLCPYGFKNLAGVINPFLDRIEDEEVEIPEFTVFKVQ